MSPSPTTYENLRAEITRRHTELSDRLQRIARYAIDHPDDIALNTVSVLAGEIGVQPSSIVRFANAFGYDGFSEMQRIFRSRLVAEAGSGYRARIIGGNRAKPKEDNGTTPPAILSKEISDDVASLQELKQATDGALIAKAIKLIGRAKTVFIAAQGRSFPVGFYFAYALARLEIRSQLLDGIGGMNRLAAKTVTPNDLLIAISFRDYSPETVGIVDIVNSMDVPIISITDSPLSPIAAPAKVSFEIRSATEDRPFRSLVAPMALSQVIIVSLAHHLTNGRKNS